MTQKTFCDFCDTLVFGRTNAERCVPIKAYGKDVKLRIYVNLSLKNHPTGWGGPPDICKKCLIKLLRENYK